MGRYCDSRCVNAVSEICTCRCGGINHGVGRGLELAPKVIKPIVVSPESQAIANAIIAHALGVPHDSN